MLNIYTYFYTSHTSIKWSNKKKKTVYPNVKSLCRIPEIHLQCRRPQFNSRVGKNLWRRDRLPTPVFLGFPGGSEGKKSTCNEGDLGLIPGWEDPLEEGMATHSSMLAWRIPMDGELGGLQSMGW